MANNNILLINWRSETSIFHSMLYCGINYGNDWVQRALKYLPTKILFKYKDELAFCSTAEKDGVLLARTLCKEREIIILSERIFPKSGAKEWDKEGQYFIFAVLHEVAHVYKEHSDPRFDNLTSVEKEEQDKEADDLACDWFNNYVERSGKKYLKKITLEQINKIREKNQKLMRNMFEGFKGQ